MVLLRLSLSPMLVTVRAATVKLCRSPWRPPALFQGDDRWPGEIRRFPRKSCQPPPVC